MQKIVGNPSKLRHLNKLRWFVLTFVFVMLVLLPFVHLYQTYVAAHAYDLLSPYEKTIYDAMEWLTSPFVSNPEQELDALKGTTWSGTLFGFKISDPLSVVSQVSASMSFYWPFILTALVPVAVTLIFGRVFCGWICPATFIYELNDTLAAWIRRGGAPVGDRVYDKRIKYLVLALGLLLSLFLGTIATAAIYPPAIIGRELYYGIAQGAFGVGTVFFMLTILFDLLVARRGFCRYICPGGALYSLLGHFRLLRIQRVVEQCNDCQKCNVVCEFGLDPLQDGFGQECNNCTACIAVCPTDALEFKMSIKDQPYQGPGHLGHAYKHQQATRQEEATS
jgi:ferredoxin-type protein NapH